MIKQEVLNNLNNQLNKEFYSAYLYLSMANYLSKIGFFGFANWMIKQSEEEKEHAIAFYNYIKSRDDVELFNIDAPSCNWNSVRNVFEDALKHEEYITQSIHSINKIASKEDDIATVAFIEKFVVEQVEEEKNLKDIIKIIDAINDDKTALFLLDKALNERGK